MSENRIAVYQPLGVADPNLTVWFVADTLYSTQLNMYLFPGFDLRSSLTLLITEGILRGGYNTKEFRMCYNKCMGFRAYHIQTDERDEDHEAKVNDALRKIKDGEEIYSIQHAVSSLERYPHGWFSTLIVIRTYN